MGRSRRAARGPSVSLAEWLEGDGEELVRRYERLYVPKNDPRWLRRNALVALGNGGRPEDAALAEPYAHGDDELLREHAEWALQKLRARGGAGNVTYEQRLRAERWLAWVRVGAVPFAAFQAAITTGYPSGHEAWTWVTTGVLAVGAAVIWWLAQRDLPPRALARLGFGALAFDFLIVSSFVLALTFVRATPIRQVLILVLIEAAFRYGLVGGLGFVVANVPTLIAYEWLRADYFHERYHYENITLQIGVEVMIALIVGWLVERLRGETSAAMRAGAARRSTSATSSGGARTCSTRRTAARARSAPRSRSRRHSARSSASCAV